MKKRILAIVLIIMIIGTSQTVAAAAQAAAPDILEVPEIRIVIDGTQKIFNDVPLSISSSTLLPLREMLVTLGVPNDDQHIAYNNAEKSVTINHDGITIYLAVGDKTAYVNGEPVTLIAAPVAYSKNQRIYIPFRFVAEAMGKKVVWDGTTRSIYVCNSASYENVKCILEKSDIAMNNAQKYVQTVSMKPIMQPELEYLQFDVEMTSMIDKPNRSIFMTLSMNLLGIEMTADTYLMENTIYSQDPVSKSWQKTICEPDQYEKLFMEQLETCMPGTGEPLFAGLRQDSSADSDEIVLKGDVLLTKSMNESLESQKTLYTSASDEDTYYETFSMEIILYSSTYRIKKVILKVGSNENTTSEEMSFFVEALYSEYEGDFLIALPEELADQAG